MADLGDHAFSLALTVLGDPAAAEDVAIKAVRRGGRSRVAVLAFARSLALSRHHGSAPVEVAGPFASAGDVALALAATRPPLERAIVDLAGRHELDRARLARTLGLAPTAAGERLAAISDRWTRDLDPALLAWLGPGDCEGLAAVLAGVDVASIDSLLDAASAVSAHALGCDVCADRVRSMAPVQTLVTSRPLDTAPAPVKAAARRSRFRPTAPLPPPIDAARPSRWPRVAMAAALVVLVAAAGATAFALTHRPASRKQRVAVLTRVPDNGTILSLSPAVVRAAGGSVLLRNGSGRAIRWHAGSTATWLAVTPADGTLAPGSVTELVTKVLPSAPEGDLQAPLTVTGDDGSVTAAVVELNVEHPPTLEATIDGCNVKATAEDESAVASVALHWRDGHHAEQAAPMAPGPDGNLYLAAIPTRAQATTWWVTAVDSRGNRTQTPEQASTAC